MAGFIGHLVNYIGGASHRLRRDSRGSNSPPDRPATSTRAPLSAPSSRTPGTSPLESQAVTSGALNLDTSKSPEDEDWEDCDEAVEEEEEDEEKRGQEVVIGKVDRSAESLVPDVTPPEDVRKIIPPALLNIGANGKSAGFNEATRVIGDMNAAPSLPSFLSKSTLNEQPLNKEDFSVLNPPSHAVVNHLGTDSVTDDVLGTSVTTRYKCKYVTTILYKAADPNHLPGQN